MASRWVVPSGQLGSCGLRKVHASFTPQEEPLQSYIVPSWRSAKSLRDRHVHFDFTPHINTLQEMPKAPPTHNSSKPRVLDLFSGTGSVGQTFEEQGYEVVSLDIEKHFKPTIVADVLKWDYKS